MEKKILNFLGDSITVGVGASDENHRYSTIVSKYFNVKENNQGVSGSRIADQQVNFDFERMIVRVPQLINNASFTIVFGGTNDFGHGEAKIGNINDTNPKTFYGALNEICTTLLSKFPKEKIVFILPLPRCNQNDPFGDHVRSYPTLTLDGYKKAMKNICNKYRIHFLDLNKYFCDLNNQENRELFLDGLHPNNNGHALLATLLVKYLEKKIVH